MKLTVPFSQIYRVLDAVIYFALLTLLLLVPLACVTAGAVSKPRTAPPSSRTSALRVYRKTAIVVHHTAACWGDVASVRAYHQSKGWRDIAYNRLITNYYPTHRDYKTRTHRQNYDGRVFTGRQPDTSRGAHCYQQGMNEKSLGVCLVGDFDGARPTARQWRALIETCAVLAVRYNIKSDQIFFHENFADKSCPGKYFPSRERVRAAVHRRILALRARAR